MNEGLHPDEQLLSMNEERPGYQKRYFPQGMKRVTPDDIQEWASRELDIAVRSPEARVNFWIMKYAEAHTKGRNTFGGYVLTAVRSVRKARSRREIKEEMKRWDNLRQHYAFKQHAPDSLDDDVDGNGDVWRLDASERPENTLLKVDLERLRAKFPILEMVAEGLTQTEIGKILKMDQRRVSEELQKIATWYRSH